MILFDEVQKEAGLVPHLQSKLSGLEYRVSETIIPELKNDVDALRGKIKSLDQVTQRHDKFCSDNFKRTTKDLETRIAEVDKIQEIEILDEHLREVDQALEDMLGKTKAFKPSPESLIWHLFRVSNRNEGRARGCYRAPESGRSR